MLGWVEEEEREEMCPRKGLTNHIDTQANQFFILQENNTIAECRIEPLIRIPSIERILNRTLLLRSQIAKTTFIGHLIVERAATDRARSSAHAAGQLGFYVRCRIYENRKPWHTQSPNCPIRESGAVVKDISNVIF